jgi:hypothetical protein
MFRLQPWRLESIHLVVRKEVEEFIESQRGVMDKFVRTNTRTSSNEDQPNLASVKYR